MAEPIKTVETPDPVFVEADADGAGLPMRKKELIDLVVERSGIKKKDAKPVVEAMLAVLGEAIGSGRELNLQPLGKLRINRSVERSNGRIIVCKLRQSTAMGENSSEEDNTGTDPLAADES
ncbi:HU family DNA-binding protein [Parasedimentitalea psychrophila]|nr:HU family DNA-binding protein [Parasedimentitalea psychrophila]